MTRDISTVALGSGLTLSYAEQGDRSGPALVLLPGPTDSWWSYQPVLERLPLSIRTVAVSQRGHGDSDKPPTGYRVQDFAADVAPLLDALGIERAVLAGHSGSCLVARRVAIDSPGRVAGLVLEASPTTLHGDAGLTEFVESTVAGLEDPIDADWARSFVVDTSSGEVGPEVLDQLVTELLKVPARAWRETFAGLLEYDDIAELGRVTAPTLLIWGDADGLVGREMQEQLAGRMACTDLIVYPGVGHTPRWENPSRFASDVTAFVERAVAAREDPSMEASPRRPGRVGAGPSAGAEMPPGTENGRGIAAGVGDLVRTVVTTVARVGTVSLAALGDVVEGPGRALAGRAAAGAVSRPRPVADPDDLAAALDEQPRSPLLGGATGAALAAKVAGRVGPLRFLARRTPMWLVITAAPALQASVARGAEELALVASHLVHRARSAGVEPDPERVRRAAVQLVSGAPVDAAAEPRHAPLVVAWLQRALRATLPFSTGVATRNPRSLARAAAAVDPSTLRGPTPLPPGDQA